MKNEINNNLILDFSGNTISKFDLFTKPIIKVSHQNKAIIKAPDFNNTKNKTEKSENPSYTPINRELFKVSSKNRFRSDTPNNNVEMSQSVKNIVSLFA